MNRKRICAGLTAALMAFAMTAQLPQPVSAAETILYGDVNRDGVVNLSDAAAMKLALLGKAMADDTTIKLMDVNADGGVNGADVQAILDFCLRRTTGFAAGVSFVVEDAPVADRYYAVDANYTQGISETTNTGYAGTAYVNYNNVVGSDITWTVNVAEAGNYAVTFRVANGSTDARPCRLTLNGDSAYYPIEFASTGEWTTWADVTVVVALRAGSNTISATASSAGGGPNTDYISLAKTDAAAVEFTDPPVIKEGAKQVEALDRGLIATKSGSGMLVSWRLLGTDAANTTFNLYRDGTKIYTGDTDDATCYFDASGSTGAVYTVDTLVGGTVTQTSKLAKTLANGYFDIAISAPAGLTMPDGSTCTYSANDCSTADVDGDGAYELILKWDPSNSQDNSKDGYTGNVYIDAIKLDGTRLWRVDLGKNIRAGAHYTQFMVYDFDGDGKAEMVCKTADGTVDGKGNVVGSATADYRSSAGRILSGPEYLTLFDGQTGAALNTIDYVPGRGDSSTWNATWGDTYGNRIDRYLAGVAYLNGTTPSVVMCRGYYGRATLAAFNVVDKKLVQQWFFDSDDGGKDKQGAANSTYRGQGAHALATADIDNDGFDEIVYGACAIDHDGKGLYSTGLGHGDALHVSDFVPGHAGLETWMVFEGSYGAALIDSATGTILKRFNGTGDTGRGIAGNFMNLASGAVFTSIADSILYDGNGNNVGTWSGITKWNMNSAIWWTGDLQRSVLDRTMIDHYGTGRLLTGDATYNNGSKSNACLTADILGDWREEAIFRTSDNTVLRVYSTTFDTTARICTLMHDVQYREAVAWQNVAYNQPPNTSFYIGSGAALPSQPNVYAAGN